MRYTQLITDEANQYNNTVWTFWNTYFAKDKALTDVLYGLVDIRGKEVDEMQQEIEGCVLSSRLCRLFFLLHSKRRFFLPAPPVLVAPASPLPLASP